MDSKLLAEITKYAFAFDLLFLFAALLWCFVILALMAALYMFASAGVLITSRPHDVALAIFLVAIGITATGLWAGYYFWPNTSIALFLLSAGGAVGLLAYRIRAWSIKGGLPAGHRYTFRSPLPASPEETKRQEDRVLKVTLFIFGPFIWLFGVQVAILGPLWVAHALWGNPS
ncbi:hypothetical protein [Bradyrhizobium sp. F1.13.3]|uniref:hypothetical protein n=1 Tax=Bradyrhizobium sp. F1.13.3 TaxID=3156351 RepID=UPI003399AB39